jgi:adenosylhomocysteinase
MDAISAVVEAPDALTAAGRQKIDWARDHMPILTALEEEFRDATPLSGLQIGMAMHVEAKTAALVEVLAAGGATVAITGCNPLSTHDDVSCALDAHPAITSYARRGVEDDAYYEALRAVIDTEPDITVDDGMDLVHLIHTESPALIDSIIGGAEETTTGVQRLRAMAADGALEYPVFAVNDSPMKHLFDNIHGTGESALASIAMTTNLALAGKTVVVAGGGDGGRTTTRTAGAHGGLHGDADGGSRRGG